MELPAISAHWSSRTPTRRGHFDPPRFATGNRYGNGPSTVEGRINEKLYDERHRINNPQLQVGMLVIYQRAPYRIVELREHPEDLWPQRWQDKWERQFLQWMSNPHGQPQPEKATWRDRPVVIALAPDGGGKERHFCFDASRTWDVLPEHYAVCRSCGELPPCREEEIEKATAAEMAKTNRMMAIPAGACMGCGETISGRQKSVAFPGPNLWRPDLADGTVRFHARSECSHWVYAYKGQWEDAGKPGSETAAQQMVMGED